MAPLKCEHKCSRCEKSEHHYSLRKDILLWGAAAAFVLVAHAAGAYVLANIKADNEMDGTPPAAIMVEFAELAIAPDAENEAAEMVEETTTEINEAEEQVEPEPELVPQPEPEPEPEVVPEPVLEPEPVEEPVEELTDEQVVEEVVAENPEVVIPLPMKRPAVEEKPQQVAEVQKKEPPKQKKPEFKPVPKKTVAKDKKNQRSSAPAVAAESGKTFAASRSGATAGNPGMSSAKWSAKVQAHLERQKRFLQRKSGARGRGVAQLNFVIDAGGNVLSARIITSTGNAQLDQLTLDMAHRASPVPAPPPAIAKARIPITVPIQFK